MVPKKGVMTIILNEKDEIIATTIIAGWSVCIVYHKLNAPTHKDHFPLPFLDQISERLVGYEFYCFLDEFSGYN